MSDWSGRKQHHSTHLHRNHQSSNSSISPFASNLSHDPRNHRSAPFSPFPSTSGDTDEVDECCSYIGKLLIHEQSAPPRNRSSSSSSSLLHHQYPAHLSRPGDYRELNCKYAAPNSASKPSADTMTIGHHYSNRHHYPYHDHYHEESPMLPRIEFPSSQFDRLLRGSPNLEHRSSDTSSTRFLTSSSRDSSSTTSLSSSSSSSSSPFSSSSSSSNNSSRHSSWKSGPKK